MSTQQLLIQPTREKKTLDENVAKFLTEGSRYYRVPFHSLSDSDFTEMRRLLNFTFLGSQILEFGECRLPERLAKSYSRLYNFYEEHYVTSNVQEQIC